MSPAQLVDANSNSRSPCQHTARTNLVCCDLYLSRAVRMPLAANNSGYLLQLRRLQINDRGRVVVAAHCQPVT
jgi:hypothetical protein